MAAINLDIGGNTRRLDRDIQKTVNRVYNINLKTKGDQPLGRITGQVNEFNKSLDASNARVIAFGASAGIIFGVQRAFSALVGATIEVQKSLQDINVILNVSAQNLQKFGGELFNIAKNTGQSFQEVAKAATEFSRQGLGVEETLKRTNEALILSRLSGLDAAKSVEALTAAVNSYASQAVTASEVVNKFANVDAAFAVSSADLAEALARVGSSAAQSGVSLNELIAIVTSAQQTTARGGAVIGNSFKTIFTRLQRGKVVDLLGTLGISDTNASGELKSTIQLLQDLGAVYDTLGARQQAAVAEQVGGVFQINILKAALADLGKEYSIYSSALDVAAGTTDQAIRRNEELNKTYAAQLNALQENARQIASAAGERLIGPSIDRLVGGSNTLLGGINESDGQGFGAVLGKGILDGLGQFIAGPGLALIGGVLLKLFRDLGKFATGSVQQLLGLNTAATQQKDLQASITQILAKNPQLLELALKGEQGLNTAASSLLANLQKQTLELQKQAVVAQQISKAFISQAGVRVAGGIPVAPAGKAGKAAGYIPNFAEVSQAIDFGAKSNVQSTPGIGKIGGKSFEANNQEFQIPNFAGTGETAVIPKYGGGIKEATKMIARGESGSVLDKGDRNRARGFVPNFAGVGVSALYPLATGSKITDYKTLLTKGSEYKGPLNKPFGALTKEEANLALSRSRATAGLLTKKQPNKNSTTNLGKTNKISLIYGKKDGVAPVTGVFTDSNKNKYSAQFQSSGFNAKIEPEESNLEDILGKQVIDFVNRFSSIFNENKNAAKIGNINQLANAGAFRSIAGTVFETAVTQATGSAVSQASRSGGQTARIDYLSPNPKLRKLFNNIPGAYEAKIGNNPELVNSVAEKAYKSGFFKKQGVVPGSGKIKKAAGYIPNFAAIQNPLKQAEKDSEKRELNAGASSGQIRSGTSPKLKAPWNPEGKGTWSTKYEGSLSEGIRMAKKAGINPKTKGMSKAGGHIPNFAIEDPDTQTASLGASIGAITAQLSTLAFAFAFSGGQYKESLKQLTSANFKKAKEELKQSRLEAKRLDQRGLGNFASTARGDASQRFRNAATPDLLTKGRAFGGANALGLSIAAPILGETIKNVAGQETSTRRGIGETGSAIGQIGSFAATGGLIGGAPGAAIGGAIGALLSIPSAIDAFTSELPDLAAAAKKASQDLTKFSDTSQRILTTSSSLSQLREDNGSSDKIEKVQNEFIKAISELTPAEQARVESSIKIGNLEEELAQITQERIEQEKSKSKALALGELAERTFLEKVFSGGGLSDRKTTKGEQEQGTIKSIFKDFFAGQTQKDTLENFKGAVGAITELENLRGEVEKNVRTGGVSSPFEGKQIGIRGNAIDNSLGLTTDYSKPLQDILENTIPKADPTNLDAVEARSQQIQRLVDTAAIDFDSFVILTSDLIETLKREPGNIEKGFKINEERDRADKLAAEARKTEKAAIDATISSIQKNIAIQNLWKSAIENLGENIKAFSENLRIEQELTQPRDTLEKLIGADKSPVRRLAAQEGLAGIQESQRSTLSSAGLGFKENVRGILEKPFQDNIDKLVADLSKTESGFAGTSEEKIRTESKEVQDKSKEQLGLLNQTMKQVEGYMAQFVSGQMSTQQLLEQSKNELSSVGIDVSKGSQASNEIEKAVAELEVKTLQEEVRAFQQRAKLASETKQAILQSKIDQALGTFGGFEGFINRPEEKENYIQRISGDLQNVEEMRSSPTFRYNNKESRKEQEKQAPELGRSFAKIYRELIDQSGGGFRSVIQSAIDAGPQLTGAESRSGRAGASARGGFDDIVRGRKQDLEEQLKLAEDQIKVTKDTTLKRDLEGFVSSIRNMPGGTQGIAQLQTQKELGVARQSDFQKLFKQYDIAAFDSLSQISPDLAASLASATALTDDPLLNEASAQTAVQSEILKTIKGLSGQESGMVEPFDMEAYANEKDPAKRAAMKAGYGGVSPGGVGSTASDEVKTQIKAIQDKVLPTTPKPAVTGPQKTIAEIEAETRAKRDQKYLQSPVAPMNRTTGKQFESIDEVNAEMTKALALGAVNPEQKEYYKVLENFKQNLDPTGGTDGRNYMFNLDDQSRPVDPNSPLEIEKRTIAQRDQRRFEGWSNAGGLGLGPLDNNVAQEESAKISKLDKYSPTLLTTAFGSNPDVMDFIAPKFAENEVYNAPSEGRLSKVNMRDWANYSDPKTKNRADGEFGKAVSQNPFSSITYDDAMRKASYPQNINQQPAAAAQQPAAAQQSFTQQEAAFSNNTSALTSLAGGIESLNSTLSNFESNFANLNNVPGTQPVAGAQQAGAQPNVTTTTNAPVNVVVNAQSGGDIAQAVGEAVQNAIPTIIDKVKVALGQKVPPTSNPK